MKRIAILIAGLAVAAAIPAQANEALAKSSGCLNCHNIEGKKMGPGFKDVAAKYKGDAKAVDTLVGKIGTKPHPTTKASDDDKKAIVTWILSL